MLNLSVLNSINPQDIDNISFLKDASSAIYGARAAGGVVLITTKRAKDGKPTIQYNASLSQKIRGMRPGFLNGDQYGKYMLEGISNATYGGVADQNWLWTKYALAWINRGDNLVIDKQQPGYVETIGFNDVRDYTFFDTDPIEILWNNTALSTQHDLSLSAKTDAFGYRLSMGYMNDPSLLKWGENSNNRYNVRLNLDFKLSEKFKVQTNISLEKDDVVVPTNQNQIDYGSQPGFPVATISGKPYAWGTQPARNWLIELGGENKTYNNNVNFNTRIEYNIIKDLTLVGLAGYSWRSVDNATQYKYISEIYNYLETWQYQPNPEQSASYYQRGQNKDTYFNTNAYLEYKKTLFADNDIRVTLGGNYERDEKLFWTQTKYQASNAVPSLGLGLGDNTTKTNAESKNHWAIASLFGRFNYSYKDKYLLEGDARYDGSSKFDSKNRWIFYSGVSLGWRISQEAFVKDNFGFINELKLRGAYGTGWKPKRYWIV